jgi:O-antigen/teichoic acid export membrane protein
LSRKICIDHKDALVHPSMGMTSDAREWLAARREDLAPAGPLRARFTAGVMWSVIGAVVSRGFTLAASVVCARLLGKERFGELGIIQSTVGTFGVFAGLGLGLTATKYVAEFRERDREKVGRILALSSVAALVSSTVMAVILLGASHYLAGKALANAQLAEPLAIGAGLVFFGGLNGAQTGALAGFEAFQAIARVNTQAGLCSFPLVVIGVWRWGLKGAVWGLVAAMAVNWILNYHALQRQCAGAGIRHSFRNLHRERSVLHKFSLPALLASIVVGPALWFCSTMLVHQKNGYGQLGLYTAADRWRLLILFVPTSVFGMLVPVLSNLYGSGDQLGFRKMFRANLIAIGGLALFCAACVSAFAKTIMAGTR